MWNYYNSSDTWDWIQIRYWPRDIAEAVINKKLKYGTRFRVMIYLVGNGMDPAMARNEVLKMGLGYFDASARQHVRDLWKDLKKNAEKWSYWDERARKILFLADTGFGEGKISLNRAPKRSLKEALEWGSLKKALEAAEAERWEEEELPTFGSYKRSPIGRMIWIQTKSSEMKWKVGVYPYIFHISLFVFLIAA